MDAVGPAGRAAVVDRAVGVDVGLDELDVLGDVELAVGLDVLGDVEMSSSLWNSMYSEMSSS
eukprot:448212-Prorocentrum_minimum.AAC.1